MSMPNQEQNKIKLVLQFFSEEPMTFYNQNSSVPQIEDFQDDLFEDRFNQASKKLWDEQNFSDIHIPQDGQVTNQEICQVIYKQLQNPSKNQNQQIINNSNNVCEQISLDKYIINILFLKFIDNFFTQKVEPPNEQKWIEIKKNQHQINMKNVITDQDQNEQGQIDNLHEPSI